jgi:hypothetical protein
MSGKLFLFLIKAVSEELWQKKKKFPGGRGIWVKNGSVP